MDLEHIKRMAWRFDGGVRFHVPPVCSARWTEADWIRAVDWAKHGNEAILERWRQRYAMPPIICSNCGQWRHGPNGGRCLNDCQSKGFDH